MSKRQFRINVDPQSLIPNDSVRKYYFASLALTMLIAGLIMIFWKSLPRSVPLFFTEPWGVTRLAPRVYLFLLPIISLLVMITNIIVGKTMDIEDQKILIYSLGIGSLTVTVPLALGLLGIIQSIL